LNVEAVRSQAFVLRQNLTKMLHESRMILSQFVLFGWVFPDVVEFPFRNRRLSSGRASNLSSFAETMERRHLARLLSARVASYSGASAGIPKDIVWRGSK
jgi:hypothetical protein